MKFRQVIQARAIRQVATIGDGAPRVDDIQRLKERYSFQKVPERFEEIYPSAPTGLNFRGGRFKVGNQDIEISAVQFIPGGMIVVDTLTSTDHSELIIDDLLTLVSADRPDGVMQTGPRYFVSCLEFTVERVPESIAGFHEAAGTINRLLGDYGMTTRKFEFWATILNVDTHNLGGGLPPAPFTFERRVGFPFDKKVFFSQAPLTTKDHLALLEKLDSIVH